MMTLKAMLQQDFGIDLPISGGSGRTLDNPIIMERRGINDYVGTERMLLTYLMKKREVEWIWKKQAFLMHGDRKLDEITIQTMDITTEGATVQLEQYYFDITDCLAVPVHKDVNFDETETLHQIVAGMEALKQASEFNRECIALLKKGQLSDDIQRLVAFSEVLLADEPLSRLFEDMMQHRKQAILVVLNRVAGAEK